MFRNFPSIQHSDKYAFRYDSCPDGYDGAVHYNFRLYETYGDGQCQHSPARPITREFMADYLASIATAMLDDAELIDAAGYIIDCGPNQARIAFAASVLYKPSDSSYSKTRYFSIEEQKISSSSSKQHDRRYEPIAAWCDGTPGAIQQMLLRSIPDDLRRYACAYAIREWVLTSTKLDMPLVGQFLNWGDREMANELRHAYGACLAVIHSQSLRSQALTHLQNIAAATIEASEITPTETASELQPA